MDELGNSKILMHVMNSFFHVISTKTSPAHAWLTIKILLQKTEYEYDFMKSVDVVEMDDINVFLKKIKQHKMNFNIVNVHNDVIDTVDQQIVGNAIQYFADEVKRYLGDKAGYRFLIEFIDDLGEEYDAVIKGMGVDLRFMQLQDEISRDEMYLSLCESVDPIW